MAEAVRYVCDACGRAFETWSDGNPYYVNESGEKQYAYHPDHERLVRCIGNDTPHLCLACGAEFKVDSRSPLETCAECGSPEIAATWELSGQRCPYCKEGAFFRDPEFYLIS